MDTQAPPVLAAPAEASAPEIPAEPESEPEKEWTQADIRRMYKAIKEPKWAFIDCLTTPDKANNCVGAVLYWDGEASTLVRFFDETGYSYCAGPVAKAADEPGFTYLGDGTVTFRLQADDGTVYDYTLTLSAGDAGANWNRQMSRHRNTSGTAPASSELPSLWRCRPKPLNARTA